VGTFMGGDPHTRRVGGCKKRGGGAWVEAAGGWAQKEKLGPGWRQRAGGHKGGEGQHRGTDR
jgi:hypothetical protein